MGDGGHSGWQELRCPRLIFTLCTICLGAGRTRLGSSRLFICQVSGPALSKAFGVLAVKARGRGATAVTCPNVSSQTIPIL
jgi:hypothetical protein